MNYRHFIAVAESALPADAFEGASSLLRTPKTAAGYLRATIDSPEPDGGEIVRKFVSICEANGLRRHNAPTHGTYGHRADRWYGDYIFGYELLVLSNQVISRAGVKNGGFVGAADPAWRAASWSWLGFSHRVVATDDVRQTLETAALRGLEFGESPTEPRRAGVLLGTFWELKSSFTLPKMSNVNQFVHPGRTEDVFEGDYSRVINIVDPPFSKGEIHYRRADLEPLGAFDVAQTFEKYMEASPALIVSQRFYKYCLANGIGLSADPVRIDET